MAKGDAMQKWEYRIITLQGNKVLDSHTPEQQLSKMQGAPSANMLAIEKWYLDKLGQEGWEAFGIEGSTMFLKRPIE
jgi:hypothetical protein